jgi:hypothetical protein
MTLKTIHSGCGVTLEQVKAELSWDVKIAKDLQATEPPTVEELQVYRENIYEVRAAYMRSIPSRPAAR